MEIRPLKEQEIHQARHIDSYCFDHDHHPERTNLFFAKSYKVDHSLGIFDGETLLSSMLILPFNVRVRDTWMKCGGISSVGTLPEYRNQGYVRKLMFHGMGRMKKSGQVISVLGPFEYDFYRRMGYGLTYEKMTTEFSMDHLRQFIPGEHSYRMLTPEDVSAMDGVYREYTQPYNAVFMRSLEEWRFKFDWAELDHHTRYGAFDADGSLSGVIHFSIKDRRFNIYELTYKDTPARHALLHLVYRHRSEADTVLWMNAPVDDPFLLEISDSRQKRSIESNMMGRIVDVPAFFAKLSFPGTGDNILTIALDDPLLVWNRAHFRFHWQGGKLSVEKTDNKEDLSLDIVTLSQIGLGYMSPLQAWKAGRLQCSDENKVGIMDTYFPKMINYLNEIF